MGLDELLPRRHGVAHQGVEHLVGVHRVVDLHLQHRPVGRIHRRSRFLYRFNYRRLWNHATPELFTRMDSRPPIGSISAIRFARTSHSVVIISLQAASITNLFPDRPNRNHGDSDCRFRAAAAL